MHATIGWPQLSGAIVVLVLGTASARAADDSAGARQHYEEGTRAYNLGEFKRAAEEYREAYRLKPDPAILYNIAQAYRLDKNFDQALFFYRSFLRNQPDTPNRKEVEGRIHTLEDQLKQQQQPPNDVIPANPESKPPPEAATTRKPGMTAPEPATGRAELVAAAPAKKPVYKKWWLWTGVGVVVVGAALGVGLGIGLASSGAPSTHFGNFKVFPQ
jgi:tetratricopeptide (TPR) repeat protein